MSEKVKDVRFNKGIKNVFSIKRVFGLALIVLGLSIIGAVCYMKYSAERAQKRMINEFQRTLHEIDADEEVQPTITPRRVAILPGDGLTESGGGEYPAEKANPVDMKAMALMTIPKINLRVAVAEGTDKSTLKYAVGHFIGTAMPGEKGNFAVAGHRSYTYNQFFNRADELDIGDKIIVTTKKGEFTYVVYQKKVVEPTDVSVLDPTDDATITLITCTPIRIATHRLIIKGKLI